MKKDQEAIMDELFVPYEVALALKELGYNKPCFAYYGEINGGEIELFLKKNFDTEARYVLAPTFSQAAQWIRDTFGIHSWIDWMTRSKSNSGFFVCFRGMNHRLNDENFWFIQGDHDSGYYIFRTHYAAEVARIQRLITMIKK